MSFFLLSSSLFYFHADSVLWTFTKGGIKKGKILLNITNKSKIRDLKMKEDWLVLSHWNFSTFSSHSFLAFGYRYEKKRIRNFFSALFGWVLPFFVVNCQFQKRHNPNSVRFNYCLKIMSLSEDLKSGRTWPRDDLIMLMLILNF